MSPHCTKSVIAGHPWSTSRLVKYNRIHLLPTFQGFAALHQDTQPRTNSRSTLLIEIKIELPCEQKQKRKTKRIENLSEKHTNSMPCSAQSSVCHGAAQNQNKLHIGRVRIQCFSRYNTYVAVGAGPEHGR
jgi:hypothetical protein